MLLRVSTNLLLFAGLCVSAETERFPVSAQQATAAVSKANYCFVRKRGILSEQMPVPALTLQLKVRVSFINAGARPLILPIDHDRTVFTATQPGVMKPMRKPVNLLEPKIDVMTHLPADVSPASPIDPPNNVFVIIPANGTTPLYEESVDLPVYRKTSREVTDLRGKRIYFRLQVEHQPMATALLASLSDRWSRFGALWTGTLRTNTFVVDVPSSPEAPECSDK